MHNDALNYLLDSAKAGGCEVAACPSGWIVSQPHITWPIFSWALPAPPNIAPDKVKGAVRELSLTLEARQRKPSFVVPTDWEALMKPTLEQMQLTPHELHHVYMAGSHELSPKLTQHVEVIRAKEPEAWLELLLDGFDVPEEGRAPFRRAHAHILAGDSRAYLYEAIIDGQRAGAALLWVDNGVAGLNTATVKPEFRRRGVYTALFAARIQQGTNLGLDTFATETAQPAVERVASQWGFSKAVSFRMWF